MNRNYEKSTYYPHPVKCWISLAFHFAHAFKTEEWRRYSSIVETDDKFLHLEKMDR